MSHQCRKITGSKRIADNDIKENNQVKINHHGKRADAIVKGMLQHSQVEHRYKRTDGYQCTWRMNIYAWLIMA